MSTEIQLRWVKAKTRSSSTTWLMALRIRDLERAGGPREAGVLAVLVEECPPKFMSTQNLKV